MHQVSRTPIFVFVIVFILGFSAQVLSQNEAEIGRLELLIDINPEEAILGLEALVLDFPSPRSYFLLARAWARIDANRSLYFLERVFELAPLHEQGWQLWADILTTSNQYVYAQARLQQKVEEHPQSSYLHLLLAQINVSAGKPAEAQKSFGSVLEIAPDNSVHKKRALFSLGYIYVFSNRFKEGESYLKQVLEQDKDYAPEVVDLAESMVDQDRWEEAGRLLSLVLDTEPGQGRALYLLGRNYLKMQRFKQAVVSLNRLLAVEPDHIQAQFFLGKSYKGDGNLELAIQHFQKFNDLQKKANLKKLKTTVNGDPESLSLVELMKRIVDNARPENHNTLNEERVILLSSQIEQEQNPSRKLSLRIIRSNELLQAGRNQEAIEETLELRKEVASGPAMEVNSLLRALQDILATAYLRLGEQQNCLEPHNAGSCLVPLDKEGVHRIQDGSRQAAQEFTRLLQSDPNNLGYRWLLNLSYMALGEYPDKVPQRWRIPPQVLESDYDIGRFRDIAPALGLDVIGQAGGSIMEDFDGDGFLDVMASSSGFRDQLRYFHNNGDGTFADWTEKGGLKGQWGGLNILQADYDNDGSSDVLILRGGWMGARQSGHPNSLLRNRGDGTFMDVTVQAGLFSVNPSQTGGWADFDLDGDLDLFIGNESTKEEIRPCELFQNNGDGTFTEVALQLGLDEPGFVKGVAWGDYNNDGYPDLYISRFEQSNLLYRNEGMGKDGWRFKEVGSIAGVSQPKLSFPTWFWDYDNDGWQDIFVSSFMSYSEGPLDPIVSDYLGLDKAGYSRLYRNNGDGTFSDVTQEAKADAVLMSMGANFGDLDNDGFLDAYFGTGQPNMMALIPNRMFRNSEGIFQDVTASGGFGYLAKGHGVSFGDVDNDGDQDIYVVLGGAFSGDAFQNVMLENPGHSNHWITLRLEGKQSNRLAVGARIKIDLITEKGKRTIYSTVGTGGSFGASSVQQEIGLGQAKAVESIEVLWPRPDRRPQIIKGVALDRIVRIQEGEDGFSELDAKPFNFK